jgi:hypothetical protein
VAEIVVVHTMKADNSIPALNRDFLAELVESACEYLTNVGLATLKEDCFKEAPSERLSANEALVRLHSIASQLH